MEGLWCGLLCVDRSFCFVVVVVLWLLVLVSVLLYSFASVVAIMADDKRLQSLKLLFSTLDSDNKGVISITTFKDVCIVR
jgi:hypothetical protein